MTLDFGSGKVVDLAKAAKNTTDPGDLAGITGDIQIPAGTPQAIKLAGTTNKFATPLSVGYQMATILTINYTVETAYSR